MDSKYGRIFTEEDVRALLEEEGYNEHAIDSAIAVASTHFPKDEPLFIFRARDKRALGGMRHYRGTCSVAEAEGKVPTKHVDDIDLACALFERFRMEHPEEMREPGQRYRDEDNNGD